MAAVPLVEVISMVHSSQSRTKIEQARKMRCFQQVTVATTSLVSRSPTGVTHVSEHRSRKPATQGTTSHQQLCPTSNPKKGEYAPRPPLTARFPAKQTHTPLIHTLRRHPSSIQKNLSIADNRGPVNNDNAAHMTAMT
ncbi:hypothetical protein CaCOL14_000637 [Colletotrichum acutatum]